MMAADRRGEDTADVEAEGVFGDAGADEVQAREAGETVRRQGVIFESHVPHRRCREVSRRSRGSVK